MSEKINNCDQVFPFFLNELSPEQSKDFVDHISNCPLCVEELKELQQVWQTLPFGMDEIDLPDSLKESMLDHIMQNIEPSPSNRSEQVVSPPARPMKRWSFVAAAVLYIAFGAAIGWGIKDYGDTKSAAPSVIPGVSSQPAQVVSQYTLKAFDPSMPGATGKCFIKQQGDSRQLILQVNGLNINSGEWAYQLWLVKEGVRYNGGTFRVNDKGDGILTYDLSPAVNSFETLGITLEPDAEGTKPRGKKVLGT
jgi:hypothetical protein